MVIFRHGTYAEYLSATTDNGTLYFCTDTHEIFKGSQKVAINNLIRVDTLPDPSEADPEKIYILKGADGATTIYTVAVNGDTKSFESLSVKDLDVSNFADSAIAKVISDKATAVDTKIPTEKAVATAIAPTLIDVSYDSSVAGDNALWTFTAIDGSTKKINTPKENFLQSAKYDNETHVLTLTLSNGDEVSVDLSDLIPSALSTTQVSIPTEGAITVELGPNGAIGGYKTGDVIAPSTTVQQILTKIMSKQIPPTYTAPSASIKQSTGASAAGSYEIGSSVNIGVDATFTKNDAGDATNYEFFENNTSVQSGITTSYTKDAAQTLSATTSYKVTITYEEGPIKNDNLGDPYPTGHIAAGSKTSGNYTLTPYRQGYFMGSTANTDAVTSDVIRSLPSKKNGAYAAGTYRFTVPVGAVRVLIACPADKPGVTLINNESALNADVTKTFTKSTIEVEGANGFTAASYNLWTFIPDVAYGQEAVLAVKMG